MHRRDRAHGSADLPAKISWLRGCRTTPIAACSWRQDCRKDPIDLTYLQFHPKLVCEARSRSHGCRRAAPRSWAHPLQSGMRRANWRRAARPSRLGTAELGVMPPPPETRTGLDRCGVLLQRSWRPYRPCPPPWNPPPWSPPWKPSWKPSWNPSWKAWCEKRSL